MIRHLLAAVSGAENVIMGRLIPAGTGMDYYRCVRIAGEELEEEVAPEAEAHYAEGLEGYAEETRVHYAGGLTEEPVELESFDTE